MHYYAIELYVLNAYNQERQCSMKRKEFIKLLERNGWTFKRHGADHDIYVRGRDRESVPRHREIDEDLAKAIIKRRDLQ